MNQSHHLRTLIPTATSDVMRSFRAAPAFTIAVLVTLALAGLIGLMILLMQLQPGFLSMAHFTQASHRTHDISYGLLFATAILGLLAQLRSPSGNVAGQLMALCPWVGLVLAALLAADPGVIRSAERILVGAGTFLAAALHPAGRAMFRSFSVSRVNRIMVALVVVLAVPMLVLASTNLGLQRTLPDDHAAMGHYGFMAAFDFTVIGVGLLASARPAGWRLTAWVAGLLPVLLGVTSLSFPNASSSLGPVWALAAIAWGVVFVTAAEFGKGAESPKPVDSGGPAPAGPGGPGSAPGPPPWVKAFAVVAVALVLLVGVAMVTGLGGQHGPGRHLPPPGPSQDAGGVGSPADASQATRTIAVTTLDDMTFEPSNITASRGETVTFTVANAGQAAHEFVLGDAAMQKQRAAQRAHMGSITPHDGPNSVHLQPGETRQLTWRFGDTALEYACHEPGHYEAGMRGSITVA